MRWKKTDTDLLWLAVVVYAHISMGFSVHFGHFIGIFHWWNKKANKQYWKVFIEARILATWFFFSLGRYSRRRVSVVRFARSTHELDRSVLFSFWPFIRSRFIDSGTLRTGLFPQFPNDPSIIDEMITVPRLPLPSIYGPQTIQIQMNFFSSFFHSITGKLNRTNGMPLLKIHKKAHIRVPWWTLTRNWNAYEYEFYRIIAFVRSGEAMNRYLRIIFFSSLSLALCLCNAVCIECHTLPSHFVRMEKRINALQKTF